jgi:hypothetical protein
VRLFLVLIILTIASGSLIEATAGTLVARPACMLLMLKAGFAPMSGNEATSPTDKYFQYLNIFMQNSLEPQDIKTLKDFSSPPNFIELFAHKIPESFMYRDDVQALLPLVDKKEYKHRLEEMNDAMSKEHEHKQRAQEQTKAVKGYYAVIGKEIPETSQNSNKDLNIKGDGTFLLDRMQKRIRNLDTGTFVDIDLSDSPDVANHEFTWQVVEGQTWLISNTNNYVNVYRAMTGERVFKIQDKHDGLTDPKLFLDANQKLNLAWFVIAKLTRKNVISYIGIQSQGSDEVREMSLPQDLIRGYTHWSNREAQNQGNISWLPSQNGELFAYSEYVDKPRFLPGFFAKRKVRVHDLTHGVENMFEFEVRAPMGEERIISFHKIDENKYQLFMRDYYSSRYIQINEVKRLDKTAKWVFNPYLKRWPFPQSFDMKSFFMPNGEVVYTIHPQFSGPMEILKVEGDPIYIPDMGSVVDIIYKPDGTPILICDSRTRRDTLAFIDLSTRETNLLYLGHAKAQFNQFINLIQARMTSDGHIEGYYAHGLSSNFIPVQFYGLFDPKTGQGVP